MEKLKQLQKQANIQEWIFIFDLCSRWHFPELYKEKDVSTTQFSKELEITPKMFKDYLNAGLYMYLNSAKSMEEYEKAIKDLEREGIILHRWNKKSKWDVLGAVFKLMKQSAEAELKYFLEEKIKE